MRQRESHATAGAGIQVEPPACVPCPRCVRVQLCVCACGHVVRHTCALWATVPGAHVHDVEHYRQWIAGENRAGRCVTVWAFCAPASAAENASNTELRHSHGDFVAQVTFTWRAGLLCVGGLAFNAAVLDPAQLVQVLGTCARCSLEGGAWTGNPRAPPPVSAGQQSAIPAADCTGSTHRGPEGSTPVQSAIAGAGGAGSGTGSGAASCAGSSVHSKPTEARCGSMIVVPAAVVSTLKLPGASSHVEALCDTAWMYRYAQPAHGTGIAGSLHSQHVVYTHQADRQREGGTSGEGLGRLMSCRCRSHGPGR